MALLDHDALPDHSQAEVDIVEAEQHRGADDASLLDIGHHILGEISYDDILSELGREAFIITVSADPAIAIGSDADREYDRQDRIGRLNTGETREVAGQAR